MHHAVAVGVAQRVGDLPRYSQGFLDRQRTFAIEPVAKRFALHKRHGVVEQAAGLSGVVERQDMGMVEAGRDLYLPEKTLRTERRGQLGLQHLDGDSAMVLA